MEPQSTFQTKEEEDVEMLHEEEDLPKPTGTFIEFQCMYRTHAQSTFATYENYQRLERLVKEGPDIFELLFFFVREYGRECVVRTESGTHIIADAYKNAISTYKKRFYDFTSVAGKGSLVWNGEKNPLVLANEAYGDIALPLPCLIAMAWFIQFDFDLEFWKHKTSVEKAKTEFMAIIRSKYTLKHRNNKLKTRQEAQQIVLAKRPSDKPHKKGVKFTRQERAEIAALIKEANNKRRQESQNTHTAVKNKIRLEVLGKVSSVLLRRNENMSSV